MHSRFQIEKYMNSECERIFPETQAYYREEIKNSSRFMSSAMTFDYDIWNSKV